MKLIAFPILIMLLLFSACIDCSSTPAENSLEVGTLIDTLESPGNEITGLAWGGGLLWAVDAFSGMIYSIDTSTGGVVHSFSVTHPASLTATGLAYSEEHTIILLGLWDYNNTGYVYQYSPDGIFKGSVSMCGG